MEKMQRFHVDHWNWDVNQSWIGIFTYILFTNTILPKTYAERTSLLIQYNVIYIYLYIYIYIRICIYLIIFIYLSYASILNRLSSSQGLVSNLRSEPSCKGKCHWFSRTPSYCRTSKRSVTGSSADPTTLVVAFGEIFQVHFGTTNGMIKPIINK